MLGRPSGFDLATTRESEHEKSCTARRCSRRRAAGSRVRRLGREQDTAHPGVGAIYFDFSGNGAIEADELICSGSYAGRSKTGANDVFLTAGHCLPPADAGIPANEVFVSFDGDGRNGVSGLIALSSYHQMPGFGHDSGDRHDLGILLLPAGSVPAGTPAVQLPRAGYLDQLKAAGTLKFRIVDLVGYGVIPIWEPAGRTQFAFDGVRRSGTSIIVGLDNADVHYNQNRNGIGTGSGLSFRRRLGLAAVRPRHAARPFRETSGGNGQCNANNQNYRVDTPLARAFLGQFLNLP